MNKDHGSCLPGVKLSGLHLTPEGRLRPDTLTRDPRLRRVLDILNPPGEETRLVGGAVRNALLGLPPGDIDLATTMRPEEVTRRVKAARLRAIPTGIAHGTVTVMVEGAAFEVTTLREDIETDGRHAVVRFGRDFARDAERRDFTMNALSVGADGHVFDTVGGLDDLAGGRVRFIGDAGTRIREDYLRVLRFFRFHATYGQGPLDPEGLAATRAGRDGIALLSRERIRTEFMKTLAAPGATAVLRAMGQAEILSFVLGGPAQVEALEKLAALEQAGADPVLRLAALALHKPGDVTRLREKLRLTNAETTRLEGAAAARVEFEDNGDAPGEAELMRLMYRRGRQASLDGVRLRFAQLPAGTDPEPWRAALAFSAQATVPVLPIGGADLLRRGLSGPFIGVALARLREAWADAGFPQNPAVLAALLDRAVSDTLQGGHP